MAPLVKLFIFLLGSALTFKSSLHRVVIDYFMPTAPPPPPGYDYFKLALQWPRSVKSTSNLTDFTIHGLWPDLRYANRTPIGCRPAPRFSPMAGNLTALLHKSWPDVLKGNDIRFWRDEWNKHGTCSSKLFKQTPYFQLAHSLRTSHNVLNYLKKNKISPGKIYQVQQFENAVRKEISNAVIYMQCNTKRQLQEIRICFDARGTSVLSCPTNRGPPYGSCGAARNNITLPA